jgi:hypothetical protein
MQRDSAVKRASMKRVVPLGTPNVTPLPGRFTKVVLVVVTFTVSRTTCFPTKLPAESSVCPALCSAIAAAATSNARTPKPIPMTVRRPDFWNVILASRHRERFHRRTAAAATERVVDLLDGSYQRRGRHWNRRLAEVHDHHQRRAGRPLASDSSPSTLTRRTSPSDPTTGRAGFAAEMSPHLAYTPIPRSALEASIASVLLQ